MYDRQDYDKAVEVISKGFLMDINKRTLELIDSDIQEVASSYHTLKPTNLTQAWSK
jgi:hypothetical protein